MKRFLYYFLYLFILFLLQEALLAAFSAKLAFVPSLLFLFIIALTFKANFVETIWLGFFAGLFSELFSAYFFGSYIFAFLVVGILFYFITSNFTTRESTLPIVLISVVVGLLVFVSMIYGYNYFISLFKLTAIPLAGNLFHWGLLWTMLVDLILFYPINYFLKFFNHEPRSL